MPDGAAGLRRGRVGEKAAIREWLGRQTGEEAAGRSLPELPGGLALAVFGEGWCSGKQSNESGGTSGNCAHATDIGS